MMNEDEQNEESEFQCDIAGCGCGKEPDGSRPMENVGVRVYGTKAYVYAVPDWAPKVAPPALWKRPPEVFDLPDYITGAIFSGADAEASTVAAWLDDDYDYRVVSIAQGRTLRNARAWLPPYCG